MIIKTGTTLTADQARAIITAYGADHVSFDGGLPVELDIADIQDRDTFTVLINSGHNVRLLLEDEQGSADICLSRLFGKCEELVEGGVITIAQWHAVAEV
jgi:hypothetical protein